ncbi:MAG TPA: DUF2442 domain-containing protein [Candidatus Acidoferrum sp.]|nr:DUF2442 domain-containing protein [Candidatus Acidoferrum sp.]
MSKSHFRLTKVKALKGCCLSLTFADGQTFTVDLNGWIAKTKPLKALQDAALFARARIGADGSTVEWKSGEIDLAADNLRNLAVEQAGNIGHERIWEWLHENQLTLEQAAAALGISRRMLIYYRDGEKPVPRAIWLACLGWQAVRPKDKVLPSRIPSPKEYAALHS